MGRPKKDKPISPPIDDDENDCCPLIWRWPNLLKRKATPKSAIAGRNDTKAAQKAADRYETVIDFIEAIEAYFKSCDPVFDKSGKAIKPGKSYTISGLRKALCLWPKAYADIAARGEIWAEAIAWAETEIEACTEDKMFTGYTPGISMILKHRFGWKDETDLNIKGSLSVSNLLDEIDGSTRGLPQSQKDSE
jgi:hypothetical protein